MSAMVYCEGNCSQATLGWQMYYQTQCFYTEWLDEIEHIPSLKAFPIKINFLIYFRDLTVVIELSPEKYRTICALSICKDVYSYSLISKKNLRDYNYCKSHSVVFNMRIM